KYFGGSSFCRRLSPSRTSFSIVALRSSTSAIATPCSTSAVAAFPTRLVISCAAKAAEDLTANRIVPVAEGIPNGPRPRRPGRSTKYLVLRSEKDLRVLGVREGHETRMTVEIGARPLPHVTQHPVTA